MITETMTDGTLTITNTDECAYYVEYDNKLAAGSGTNRFEYPDGLVVVIEKGAGDDPEVVTAYAYGLSWYVVAPDHEVTGLCVPVWEGM